MPSEVSHFQKKRLAQDGEVVLCPYFSICPFKDAIQAASEKPDTCRPMLINVGIDLASISRYKSLSDSELHFHPSSLSFDMVCLMDTGIIHVANLGLQKKVRSSLWWHLSNHLANV